MGSSGGRTYTRDEALALVTDPRIGLDRRVIYALQFFTGMRIGETCGRRWRDWEPDSKPLGFLRVHTQYDDQTLKTAKSGDSKERAAPVHPELEKVLWCWQGRGSRRSTAVLRAPTTSSCLTRETWRHARPHKPRRRTGATRS
ncbi:MAG: hypothetical protein WBN14_15875 [Polyangiales bacterium]